MKPKLRDYLSVMMAFAAVFLCGYGVGHLIGARKEAERFAPIRATGGEWMEATLPRLRERLDLRPEQMPLVERELDHTALEIRKSHDTTILEYHQHILGLYQRLIDVLDDQQAEIMRKEKKSLEEAIENLSNP